MTLQSGIARLIDQAPWKTPDQLVVERQTEALHDPAHGRTLPVFMGSIALEGIVFWRDGPRVVTETHTETTWETVYTYQARTRHPWHVGAWLSNNNTSERVATTTTTTTTTVLTSFAVAHSFNQFQRPGELLKVEFNDIVIYDAIEGIPATGVTMRVYDGIDNDFDPAMVAKDGAALTPAYHGLRYIFFEDFDLVMFDGAIPASIRILWGDAESSGTSGAYRLTTEEWLTYDAGDNIPVLATAAEGYTQVADALLCYDEVLDRFYTNYEKDGVYYLAVTHFASGQELSLSPLSGLPGTSIGPIVKACAIPGTGLILGRVTGVPDGTRYNVLVDAATGAVIDSHTDSSPPIDWWCALELVGESTFIAAGSLGFGASDDMRIAFMAVDASEGTLDLLQKGSNDFGDSTISVPTPGFADGTGTSFYVRQSGGDTIYEALFTALSAPTWREVRTISGATIYGIDYDPSLDVLAVAYSDGTARATSIDPTTGDSNWTVSLGSTVRFIPSGGAYSSGLTQIVTMTANLLPGFSVVTEVQSGGTPSFRGVMDLRDGSIVDIEPIDGSPPDHYSQETVSSDVGLVSLHDELVTFSKYDDDRGGLLTDAQVTTVGGLELIFNGGVIIDADTDLRELASRLAELYGVVKVETATGVKWVLKGKDGDYVPDVVLTEADLAEERRGDAVVKIATRHRNPREVPAEIEVRYISSDADYEPMPARAAWPQGVYDTAISLLKRSLSVPVVLTDQQALELAWGLLARARAADRIHSLKLRPNRLKIEPSDVFELTAGGQTITGMFTKQTKGPDHSLEMVAEGYLSRAATTVVAESPIIHVHPTPSTETLHIFLDGPLLDASHDSGGSYLVGYSVLTGPEGWAGGSVWRLRAGESEWTQVGTRAGSHPVVGTLSAPLPASPWPFETDTENELTFSVDYGDADEIAAQTEEQFYEAASILAVGAPGRWNFITFRDVTVDGDTITLGRLRQGLRGTEVYEGTSLADDRVVLIKPNQPMEIGYDLADYDETVGIKAPAIGVPLGAVSAENFTVSGAADTPRAPGNLDAEIDGTDIDLTWDRRSRLEVPADGEFGDDDEAPLGADLDVYLVEILDGPGGTVVRTYADVSGEAKTYEAADITSDFGTMPDALTFTVRQKTSITGIGHGYAAERSVALA